MSGYEVDNPIQNSPFLEPTKHWLIVEGHEPELKQGRRSAGYWYRPPTHADDSESDSRGVWVELPTVNLIRARLNEWRAQGRPGISRTTVELLHYWTREGRGHQLFFAQIEAAETIIFLREARSDLLQGIWVPLDEPSEERKGEGYKAFLRYACKMATGGGKTTVMAMLAAWSILNKVANRTDARFSDVVLAICPNITIKNRLAEIDPKHGEASLYRTRDLVPPILMPDLQKGRVVVWNWHVLEAQALGVGSVSARVVRIGKRELTHESLTIAGKTTSMRGSRYVTPESLMAREASGELRVLAEEKDEQGNLRKVTVERERYVESDAKLVERVIGREVGGKQNILILNDEAHHAYRIRTDDDADNDDEDDDSGSNEYTRKEATVWIDGLDKINKVRGINFCIDLSATPYFIGRVGNQQNAIFPWVVSEFGLTDAIESGLTKIPQLAVRDNTGNEIPGYFNIWTWILPRLTTAERGPRKGSAKPEAILKHAATPISMMGGLWDRERIAWATQGDESRPPVYILICKNTAIARVVHEWLAEGKAPTGISAPSLPELRNSDRQLVTIRVDTKVVHETDSDSAKGDEVRWMRFTLDTVGKREWPIDRQGRNLYPEGFESLAEKLKRSLHPPGRDVRCIVSVGMLTEGWDCNTVTHIVGLRPFMSQLLCEQVVGRGLRRASYAIGADGKLAEEVAQVLGVPFEIIPFKANPKGERIKPPQRHHIHAVPEKAKYAIRFPRIERYVQILRNRITVDWAKVATLTLDPMTIPPEVEVKGMLPNNNGRPSLTGPGRLQKLDLNPYRQGQRLQQLCFEMTSALTRDYAASEGCHVPPHVLFPQLLTIVEQYVREKVRAPPPAEIIDMFLSPYYGWAIEQLASAIQADTTAGEAPELPVLERNRPDGTTADVGFWSARDIRPVVKSHVNYAVLDTNLWEQSATYHIDSHRGVVAFVKNAGLGFAIPYLHNGQTHDYEPDFIVRLTGDVERYIVLETKGYDPLMDVKRVAAERWCTAINTHGGYGQWLYRLAVSPGVVPGIINAALNMSTLRAGRIKEDLASRWAGDPILPVCIRIVDFVVSLPANQQRMLTLEKLSRGIGSNQIDSELLRALAILVKSRVAAFDAKVMFIDRDKSQYEISNAELEGARISGNLVHPKTGEFVPDFESKIIPFFVPSKRFREDER